MGWLYAMAALGVMAVLTPIVIWIFQGNARPRGGGLGPTLGDLNAFFDPSRRNIEAVKEQRSIKTPDGDPPKDATD